MNGLDVCQELNVKSKPASPKNSEASTEVDVMEYGIL